MENIKKIMFLLLIVIIIIIGILVALLSKLEAEVQEKQQEFSNENGDVAIINEDPQPVKNETMYYTVLNCIQNYIDTLILNTQYNAEMTEDEIEALENETGKNIITSEEEKANAILSMLNKDYVKKNNLTINSIYNTIKIPSEYTEVNINKMIYKDGETIQVYGVYATLKDEITENAQNENVYYIVTLDLDKMTYCIETIEASSISDIYDLNLKSNINSIEANGYNAFTYNRTTQQNTVQKYISDYKNLALRDVENAYLILNEEYRDKRFGNLEEYKKYISNNKDKIRKISIQKYMVNSSEEYTEYICIDSNNNYYIFRVTAVMEYSLILDTYTINLPEFTEKYNKASESEKVALNVQKIFEALKNEDFKYIYNKLNNTFKQNNFNTIEKFENYMKQNYPSNYEIEYGQSKEYGGNYTQEVILTDSEGNKKNMTIIMKLKDNMEFEMSFNVE